MTSDRPLNDGQKRALAGLAMGYTWQTGSLPSLKRRGLVASERSWANGRNGTVRWRLTDAGRPVAEECRVELAERAKAAGRDI